MTSRKVAVITGGGGGIGGAIAAKLVSQDWAVVVADHALETASAVAEACRARGGTAEAIACDVAKGEDVRKLVDFAIKRFGGFNGFIANAGISGLVTPIAEYPDDVFDSVISVNLRGVFLSMKHALPAMRAGVGGSFVAMGSTASIRGRGLVSAYVASKHAVLGLVRTAAVEYMDTNVRINAVLPGPIHTSMMASINEMAAKRNPGGGGVLRATPAPYGKPEDIANTVAFLMSAESSHMNGSAMVVDAGNTAA
jgi:NAD(P)-dependent dehydrogenase (short-subunit alcohol dehydrogenase family)